MKQVPFVLDEDAALAQEVELLVASLPFCLFSSVSIDPSKDPCAMRIEVGVEKILQAREVVQKAVFTKVREFLGDEEESRGFRIEISTYPGLIGEAARRVLEVSKPSHAPEV